MYNTEKFYADNLYISYGYGKFGLDDYKSFLSKTDENSLFIPTTLGEMEVVPVENTLDFDFDRVADEISDDAVRDTGDNAQLGICIHGKIYPLGDCAVKSLLDRCKINGRVLQDLSRETLAEILNKCIKEALSKEKVLYLLRYEKIRALHSGGEKDYSVLRPAEAFDRLYAYLTFNYSEPTYEGGYWDNYITQATLSLPNNAYTLLGSYKKELEKIEYDVSNMLPIITFATSDTGYRSLSVSWGFKADKVEIPLGNGLELVHRYGVTIKDFSEKLTQLYGLYEENLAKLKDLLHINLDYPVNAFIMLCRKLKLPIRYSSYAADMFAGKVGDNPATAHSVYMALQEIPALMLSDAEGDKSAVRRKVLKTRETLASVIGIKDWNALDIPVVKVGE